MPRDRLPDALRKKPKTYSLYNKTLDLVRKVAAERFAGDENAALELLVSLGEEESRRRGIEPAGASPSGLTR